MLKLKQKDKVSISAEALATLEIQPNRAAAKDIEELKKHANEIGEVLVSGYGIARIKWPDNTKTEVSVSLLIKLQS